MNALWLALALASTPAQGDVNIQVNAIYERIAAAARDQDPLLSRRAYAPDAVFLDERRPGMQAGDELHESMRGSMEALRESGAQARISYRVTGRTVQGNIAIDSGYYRVSITPSDRETSPSASYRKFLVAAERREDGRWHITHDASLPSSQEAYDSAQPVAGLRYDP